MEIEVEERMPVPAAPPIESWQLVNAPVAKLFIDRRYQRGLVKHQVKRLVNGWDWDKYHPISIAHRADGRYAVIAGQQRTTAALELGIEYLPAVLRVAQDIHQEAKQYLGSGEVAHIQASDRFKARLIANEQKAFDIWNVVENCGFSLKCMRTEERPGGYADPFSIEAVYALEQIFDMGYLEKTLKVVHRAWSNQPTKDMVQGSVIMGIYMAIRHLEQYEVNNEELGDRLGKISAKELIEKGIDRYRSMVHSRSIQAGVAAVVVDQFNYRRREPVPEFSLSALRARQLREAAKIGAQKRDMSKLGKKGYAATEASGKMPSRFRKRE